LRETAAAFDAVPRFERPRLSKELRLRGPTKESIFRSSSSGRREYGHVWWARRVCINSVLCKCAFVDIGKAREAWEFGLAVSASPHVRQGCRRGRRIVRVVLA